MLYIKDSIRIEKYFYVFNCTLCFSEIKSKPYYLNKHSGLCRSCCMKKRPYEQIFNKLKNTAKNEKHDLDITYLDFLKYTNEPDCYYCGSRIDWQPYGYIESKYRHGSYFLDRRDNDKGYSVENCLVCCTRCNIAKGNRYTYEEWYGMTAYFRNK